MTDDQLLKKLLSKVTVMLNGCWHHSATPSQKYPQVYDGCSVDLTHRISWKLFNGNIPNNLWVLHKCDNPRCCNPSHLFLGTNKENTQDRHNKNRDAKGSRNGNSKITEDVVLAIKREFTGERGQCYRLSEKYGISYDQVRNIVFGHQWKHIVLEPQT